MSKNHGVDVHNLLYPAAQSVATIERLAKDIMSVAMAVGDDEFEALRETKGSRADLFTIGVSVGYLRGVADALGVDVEKFVGALEWPEEALTEADVISRAATYSKKVRAAGLMGKAK